MKVQVYCELKRFTATHVTKRRGTFFQLTRILNVINLNSTSAYLLRLFKATLPQGITIADKIFVFPGLILQSH